MGDNNAINPVLDLALRLEVEDLYARYAACLDHGDFKDWPEFFTEECTYKVIPRENHDRGLPLATLSFESKRMLRDRVFGISETLFHQPYYQRHIVSGVRITGEEAGQILAGANYLVIRTKKNQPSDVFNAGRYIDRLVRADGRLLFASRLCVFDSELIPNSIIYPI
jgi:salicylate 5-hydroxylase small subunit